MRAAALALLWALSAQGCETPRHGRADASGAETSSRDAQAPLDSAGPSNTPDPGEGTITDDPKPGAGGGVCAQWADARAHLNEGKWSGSVVGCKPGDLDVGGRSRALALINAYRALAGLSPVDTSGARDANAQACALLMTANGALSHNPPADWACRTPAAVLGAGSSNIATTAAVRAVDLYMVDNGNEATLGHRRWLLSNHLGPVGIGSTDTFSCVWVFDGEGTDKRQFTAFPPEGDVPLQLFGNLLGWPDAPTLDDTGWSVQSDAITLTKAKVTVTRDGQTLPVTVSVLAPGYGSASAISFRPDGWSTRPGSYAVSIEGVSPAIHYTVNVVDCP